MELKNLSIEIIDPNPYQPRNSFDTSALRELATSIAAEGLIQPISVRPKGDRFELIAGERRLRAFQILARTNAEYSSIPAVVQDRDEASSGIAALVENVIRRDLNPIERANSLVRLRDYLRVSWGEVAERVGVSERYVKYLAGLLSLRTEFREAIANGSLTEKHGRALRLLKGDAAWGLFQYLIQEDVQVSGNEALDLARTMKKHPGLEPESVQSLLKTGAVQKDRRSGPRANPHLQVVRGLKTFLKDAGHLDIETLTTEQKNGLIPLLNESLVALRRIENDLSR